MAEENSNNEDDVLVELLPNGILKARVTQVTDYQLRAPAFNNLCLWDAAAQLDKVRIPATKTDSKSASAPEYNAYTLHSLMNSKFLISGQRTTYIQNIPISCPINIAFEV